MAKYSPQFQENAVRQLMPPLLRSVAQVSRDTGVSEPTLYAWKKRFQSQGALLPTRATQPEGWDAKAKLAAIIQTAAMNEAERSAWCREHGLYSEQLDAWRAAFESMDDARLIPHSELAQVRKDKRDLQKELQRKDRALAETAALLALSKKARAIWGDEDA
jgi:transposase